MTVFKCLLVDLNELTCCFHADYDKSARSAGSYQAATNKFKEGAVFIMKWIAFVKQTETSYLSAPKRGVVDLTYTTAQAVKEIGAASAAQPCPSGTVCEKL